MAHDEYIKKNFAVYILKRAMVYCFCFSASCAKWESSRMWWWHDDFIQKKKLISHLYIYCWFAKPHTIFAHCWNFIHSLAHQSVADPFKNITQVMKNESKAKGKEKRKKTIKTTRSWNFSKTITHIRISACWQRETRHRNQINFFFHMMPIVWASTTPQSHDGCR